ncbi:MAG: dephospho-CoA kinase [Steroidobacteraceae bacterium]
MLRAGLTGGIGCGKSTVAAILRDLGCAIIEADRLAHSLLDAGQPAYAEVIDEFGRGILDAHAAVDRGKLAQIVFHDRSRLARLNEILHPRVLELIGQNLARLAAEGKTEIAVVEAALLIEANYHGELDRLIVVWCRPEQQRERLLARGLTAEQIEQRIASQLTQEEKRRLASDEIDNSGTLEETRRQTEKLFAEFRKLAARA